MFSPLSMGTNRMLGVDASVPITTNNFEIRVFGMSSNNPASFADTLTLSTAEIGDIVENQDDIVVHYGNGLIRFPSKVSYADVDWTLNCFCEPDVVGQLQEWRNQVYDPRTELMGLPSQYMKNVYFIRYDGRGQARQALRCPGTWIKGLDFGAYSQTGGELVQVKTTLVISKAIYMGPDDLA